MPDTDDVAGIGVDGAARPCQQALIQESAHAQRTARAGFLIHDARDRYMKHSRLQQAFIAQERQRIQATDQPCLVIGGATSIEPSIADCGFEWWRGPRIRISLRDGIHMGDEGEARRTLSPGHEHIGSCRIARHQLRPEAKPCGFCGDRVGDSCLRLAPIDRGCAYQLLQEGGHLGETRLCCPKEMIAHISAACSSSHTRSVFISSASSTLGCLPDMPYQSTQVCPRVSAPESSTAT